MASTMPSVLSGARCLSSTPLCPSDLVAKGSEFFLSEAKSHLAVTLSSGGSQYLEEPKLKVSGQRRSFVFLSAGESVKLTEPQTGLF